MGKLLNSFMDYLLNTPEEQLKKDWTPSGKWDGVGPTLVEFLEIPNDCKEIEYHPQEIKDQSNIIYEKSETEFRTFFFNIFAIYNY